tara:strand:+ start:55226 stop:55543 length:318 start_codon:yes stop_codon:yes gene_type:complete
MNLILPNYLFLLLESFYFWKGFVNNNVLTLLIIDLSLFLLRNNLNFCLKLINTYFSLVIAGRKLVEIIKCWIDFIFLNSHLEKMYGGFCFFEARLFNRQTFVNLK